MRGVASLRGLYVGFQERHAAHLMALRGFGSTGRGALRWKYNPEANELYYHSDGGRICISADHEGIALSAMAGDPAEPCFIVNIGSRMVLSVMDVEQIWDRPDRVEPLFRLLETLESMKGYWRELLVREPELRTLRELVHLYRLAVEAKRRQRVFGAQFLWVHQRATSMSAGAFRRGVVMHSNVRLGLTSTTFPPVFYAKKRARRENV
jgi:hypothetical protein